MLFLRDVIYRDIERKGLKRTRVEIALHDLISIVSSVVEENALI